MSQTELIVERLQLLSMALLFVLMTGWMAWHYGFFQFSKQEPSQAPVVSLSQLTTGFLVYLGAQLFFVPFFLFIYGLIYAPISDLSEDEILQGWMNIGAILGAALTFFLFLQMIDGEVFKGFWKGSQKGISFRVQDFFLGVCSWFVAYPVVIIFGQLVAILVLIEHQGPHLDQVAVKQLKMTEESPLLFWATAGCIIFLIPVIEEILFRGLLQTWLKNWMKSGFAILVASLIFALFHFSTAQGTANWELLTSLFVLSIFLGFLYERQRSLLASIGLHSTFNAVSVLLILWTT